MEYARILSVFLCGGGELFVRVSRVGGRKGEMCRTGLPGDRGVIFYR